MTDPIARVQRPLRLDRSSIAGSDYFTLAIEVALGKASQLRTPSAFEQFIANSDGDQLTYATPRG